MNDIHHKIFTAGGIGQLSVKLYIKKSFMLMILIFTHHIYIHMYVQNVCAYVIYTYRVLRTPTAK